MKENEIMAERADPRIEPGNYVAICYKTSYGIRFGGIKKLYVNFRIIKGQYTGIELFMVCQKPTQKKFKSSLKFCDQWCLAIDRKPIKGERFNKDIYLNKVYEIIVRNSKRKFDNGKMKPVLLQYSVVDSIVAVLSGVPQIDRHNL